jgi:hypothetical protein
MRNIYIKTYLYHSQHMTCVSTLLSGERYKHLAYTRFGVQARKRTVYTRQATYVERYTAARSRNVYTSSAIVTVSNNFSPIQRFYGDFMTIRLRPEQVMRRPDTDSTSNKPVTLPRNQLLIRYAGTSPVHTVTIRCYDIR